MTYEEGIQALRKTALTTIYDLAREYKDLVNDAKISEDNLQASYQKLQLDRHAMVIDQKVRNLLVIIRRIKEMKVADNSHQRDREVFEGQCNVASRGIRDVVQEAYAQLSTLADQGFAIRQAASKLLR